MGTSKEFDGVATGGPGGGTKQGSQLYVYYLTCFATIGGLLFGYDTGIISGSMLLIGDVYNLTTIWKELIVSATVAAAAVFALIAGYLNDAIGRKKVIMLASVIFTGGAIIMAAANGKEMLLVGRVVVGAGIGIASMSIPVYVAEAAPAEIRGRLVTINQLFITIGIVISSVVAGLFSVNKENGWRYMLGIAGVPSVIQFIGFFGLPESPRWLMEKGRTEDARKALKQIRRLDNVDEEMQEIQDALERGKALQSEAESGVLSRMLKTQPVRRALFLGCGLQLFQQLCGINTVIYYSGSILKLAGFPVEMAIWLVCVPNGVNCLCTLIGIWLVEKSGRRILIIISMIGVMIGLAVLAIGFQLSIKFTPDLTVHEYGQNHTLEQINSTCFSYNACEDCISNEACGYCYEKENPQTSGSCLPAFKDKPERYAFYQKDNFTADFRCNEETTWKTERSSRVYYWADSYCPTDYSWMAILGLALFVMGFAPGLGPMPWTINSEIYPTWARSTGMSLSTATTWLFNLLVSLTFLTLIDNIGIYGLGPMPWTINSEIYPTWARSTGTSLATATNWLFNLLVSLTFLTLLESIGKYGTFWLYFGVCFIGLLFVLAMLPETKGRSLEEVQELFMSKEYKENLERQRASELPTDTKF